MKFQNRIAAVLTSVMLFLNGLGTSVASAASESAPELLGMTKIFTMDAENWDAEGVRCDLPAELDWLSLTLYTSASSSVSRVNMSVEVYDRFDRMRESYSFDSISSDNDFQMKLDVPASTAYLMLIPERPTELPEDSDFFCAVYASTKNDRPDPSFYEITGTTTGTAVVGQYSPDYDPWVTNEHGDVINRGTNAYYGSDLNITRMPKQYFALGEPFTTAGLQVVLTEKRRFNERQHDISECLQIQTNYNPDEPGEYIVYIRTDYKEGDVSSDDYLTYSVYVDPDYTYVSTEEETSLTERTTETEAFSTETSEPLTDDSTQSVETETTSFTESTSSAETESETESDTETDTEVHYLVKVLPGDVDCSGQVAIADAILLARYLAEDAVTVTMEGLMNAELDGDSSSLSASDLSVLLQYLAGNAAL